ncbi:MAG: hypothetical protein NTW96_09145 [Planctomycetia bacterium]|nr:hypothetical protein [Planctomycetia bacterium]
MRTRWIVLIVVVAVVLLFVLPIVAFLTLPFMLSQMPRGQTTVWATVSSDPPMFTVEMPANAKRQVATQQGPGGEVTISVHESNDDVATYTACVLKYPGDLDASQGVLDDVLNNAMAQIAGRVLSRRTVLSGEHVGREGMVEFIAGATDDSGGPIAGLTVLRAYCLRDSIVLLTVRLPKEDKSRPAVDSRIARFFDSLKLQ